MWCGSEQKIKTIARNAKRNINLFTKETLLN
jgi:hypothetical protein